MFSFFKRKDESTRNELDFRYCDCHFYFRKIDKSVPFRIESYLVSYNGGICTQYYSYEVRMNGNIFMERDIKDRDLAIKKAKKCIKKFYRGK